MPVYSFRCIACNHTEEDLYFVTEPLPEICPECKNKTLVQQLGTPCAWHPASAVFNGHWDWVNKRADLAVKNNDDLK